MLESLYVSSINHCAVAEACNEASELLPRINRFEPDTILIDEAANSSNSLLPDIGKVIKATHQVRIILLTRSEDAGAAEKEAGFIDDVAVLSKDVIAHILKT